ncbi:ATP-binding protein [Streptomyces sp. NPDC096205]|uniref:ATP-binding protein n=1 Tax=Streptomyces sp. NPDC096205 TaxID=3366081 RepID=UPI003825D044
MREDVHGYNAAHITVLTGLEAIRKRPGMYVGSVGERGLHQAVFEVVSRAVNEVLAGRASCVDVALGADGGVRVADDGPGVPAEEAADTDGPGLEALLTRMRTAAVPGRRSTVSLGLFGLGPCVTNALSSHLTAEVWRDGMRWVQEYRRGVAVAPPTAVGPTASSGTTITFWPDSEIFETVDCSFAVLEEHFRELALLNQRLEMSLTDARVPGEPRSVRFRYPGGVRDFVALLDASVGVPIHPDVVAFGWEDQRMQGRAEVALRWCGVGGERVRSFVNSWATDGGTHVEGFRDAVADAVNAYARKLHLLARGEPDVSADRISKGLTAVVSLKLDRPEFEGATRRVLGNAAVRNCVGEGLREHLDGWLAEHPEQAAAIAGWLVAAGVESQRPAAGPVT